MGRGFNALFRKAEDRNQLCFAGVSFLSSVGCKELWKTLGEWKSEQKWLDAEGEGKGLEYTAQEHRNVQDLLSAR